MPYIIAAVNMGLQAPNFVSLVLSWCLKEQASKHGFRDLPLRLLGEEKPLLGRLNPSAHFAFPSSRLQYGPSYVDLVI